MLISVLTDNNPGSFLPAEHGLSYFIEHDGKKVLFDTGQSDMFLHNAIKMKVDLSARNLTVLSHGHFDHGNGLEYLTGRTLLCHPGCFTRRFRTSDRSYIGLYATKEQIQNRFELITCDKPYKISEKIIFLGEIPRITDFESKKTSFVFENGEPDFVMDDSGVAFIHDEGLFIITGCGHAGIVNTIEHARKVTGENRIFGVMGGFHLKEADRQTSETISYLKSHNVRHVLPSHCTALPALSLFHDAFKFNIIKSGENLKF